MNSAEPIPQKRVREDEPSPGTERASPEIPEQDSKKRASNSPTPVEMLTPPTTTPQTPAPADNSPMSILSIESAMLSPLMELQPGYTVATCGRFIAAWNSLSQPHNCLHSGSTAKQLLAQALQAEERLRTIAATNGREAHPDHRPSDACKALAEAHGRIREERAASNAAGNSPIALTKTESIGFPDTPL